MSRECILTEPRIVLVTGNMAAGKSTVAQALAERLPKCVHLRGDVFRRMIVTGRAEMSFELSPAAEAQLQLRYDLSAMAARRYCEAGFSVVYQDVLIGPALGVAVAALHPHPLSVVVLCPSAEVVACRENGRSKRGYADQAALHAFDQVLRFETPRIGYWLDSSSLTVEETVERIVCYLEQTSGAAGGPP